MSHWCREARHMDSVIPPFWLTPLKHVVLCGLIQPRTWMEKGLTLWDLRVQAWIRVAVSTTGTRVWVSLNCVGGAGHTIVETYLCIKLVAYHSDSCNIVRSPFVLFGDVRSIKCDHHDAAHF